MNWSPDSFIRYMWFPLVHKLSPPSLTFPRGGEIVTGDVDITWAPADDDWGHNLLYNVYYSPNNGITWISLVTGITTTSYVWDSTSVPDGINYMIKVNATCEKGFFTETITEGSFTIKTYNPRGIIIINSNNDLKNQFPGHTGTIDDPIRIENISIASSSGMLISISGTTLYFHIADNLLNGFSTAWRGIYLQNVGNCTIANNTIYRCEQGISFDSSFNNTIVNNSVYNNKYNGIRLNYSNNNTITNNTVHGNIQQSGIWLDSSDNNTLTNNTAYNNGHGIELSSSSNNTISHNKAYDHVWSGIDLKDLSSNNLITNSRLFNNDWTGIALTNCNNNSLINNTGDGIVLQSSSNNNTLTNNTLGNPDGHGIGLLSSNDNNISNNTIKSALWSGIILKNSNNNTLNNNTAYNSANRGINLEFSSNNTLSSNMVYNNTQSGIQLNDNSKNNTLSNNTIYNNARGIVIWQSTNNSISGNNLTNNGLTILTSIIPEPGSLEDCLQGPVVDNTVNGKPLVYYENVIDDNIPSGAGQVILVNCTDVTVKNQYLDNTTIGILVLFSSHITLYNNTVQNNRHGILLTQSNSNTLTNYTGYNNNVDDIFLFGKCNNNILSNNTVGNYANIGIRINWDSTNNTIINNTVFNCNEEGIMVYGSDNNTISHNTFLNNQEYGITLDDISHNIKVQFNEFVGNNMGGSQAADNGSNNVFTYNYWSDWTSPDADADGIVDNPYSIEGNSNNQDQYPLVVSPNNHYLLVPIITSPSGGETLSGDVSISWSTSVDTWGYSVTYKVSYSTDGAVTWTLIIADRTATSFIWDTSTAPDESNYLINVEAISTGGLNAYSISTSPITIDNTPPLVTIDSPLTQTYMTDTITITLSSDDAVNYWYYIESVDTQNQTWTSDVTRTLTDDTYTLHAYGEDSVGNIAHRSVTFTIEIPVSTTPLTTPTTTTPTTTTPTRAVTPGWIVLLSLFVILLFRHRRKKS